MEGRGGCCTARYGGAAGAPSEVGRIMLRFRPIAPKPVSGAADRKPEAAPAAANGKKRKGGVKEGKRGNKKRQPGSAAAAVVASSAVGSADGGRRPADPVVRTLPLMPLTPERDEKAGPATDGAPSPPSDLVLPAPTPVRPSASQVTVECLTGACDGDGGGEIGGGVEKSLEGDRRPALVSDAEGRVAWTNAAYKRVVGSGEEEGVRVALATRGMLTAAASFSCRVRVKYLCGREKGSLTAPCDVWRLADGGLLWRLDTDTALSLRR